MSWSIVHLKYKFTQNTDSVILSSLGSFWSHLFNDTDTLLAYLQGLGVLGDQSYLDMKDTFEAVSVSDIPVFRDKLWSLYEFDADQVNSDRYYSFSDNKEIGSIFVGQKKEIRKQFKLPLPSKLVDISAVVDSVADPSYVYLKNIDFIIEGGFIVFYFNPTEVFTLKNDKYRFWLFNSQEDKRYVQNCFGEFIKFNSENSDNYYKEVVNNLWRSLEFGTSNLSLRQLICNSFGIPTVFSNDEVVEKLVETDVIKQVITNKAVYEYQSNVNITVEEGDVLQEGDCPVDAVEFYVNKNNIEDSDIYGLVLDREFIQFDSIRNNLIFLNKDVSVEVATVNGKLRPSFPVTSVSKDNDAYWDSVYAYGEANGINIAGLFRKDEDYLKEVNFLSEIKSTINPLKFLTSNILAVNMFLVVINSSATTKTLKRRDLSWFRRFIPINSFIAFTLSKDTNETVENNVTTSTTNCLASEQVESVTSPSVSADAFYVSN